MRRPAGDVVEMIGWAGVGVAFCVGFFDAVPIIVAKVWYGLGGLLLLVGLALQTWGRRP